jgi:hypothetical protein
MNLYKKWIGHLKENKMTYLQHFKFAVFYGSACLVAAFSLLLHAIFPCWFQTAGSDLIRSLAIVFKKHQQTDDT